MVVEQGEIEESGSKKGADRGDADFDAPAEFSGKREGREGGREGRGQGGYSDGGDRAKAGAMEVVVSHNIEKAMKILKRKLIKEGLFKELKSRRYYEKPSERRKRKEKESRKKLRKEEARIKKGSGLF